MPDFLTFLHLIVDLDGGFAGRNLSHSNENDSDFANEIVVSVDDEDLACGHCAEEGLAVVRGSLVELLQKLGLVEEVGALDGVDVLDDSVHGGVPSVVVEGREEGLVDGSAHEVLGVVLLVQVLRSEHVAQRVLVVFEPELISQLDVEAGLGRVGEGGGLAGIHDHVLRGEAFGSALPNGPLPFFELPEKPLVPVFEAVVLKLGVTNVLVVVDELLGVGRKPPVLLAVHEAE